MELARCYQPFGVPILNNLVEVAVCPETWSVIISDKR